MKGAEGEKARFDKMEATLYSAVISDILDEIGVRDHTLNNLIRPVRPDMVLAGRSVPIEFSNVFEEPETPYNAIIEVLDGLKLNEVPLITTGGNSSTAVWGELLSTASRARGARGAIIDGLSRDTRAIVEMKFPVFCTGTSPTDSKGRSDMIRYRHQVRSGDVVVKPGDILFADQDGVVAIPTAVEKEVLKRAYEKMSKENAVRRELQRGNLLREAWKKHGVL